MGLDNARVVHDEDVSQTRRRVWSGLERLRTGTGVHILRFGGKGQRLSLASNP
jgi:hypothetical protein